MRSVGLSLLAAAFVAGGASLGWACPAHEEHVAKDSVVAMDSKAPQSTKIQIPAPRQPSSGS